MQVAAGQFKAQCLKLVDQVQQTKEEIIITKQGKPVARLVPIEAALQQESIIGWMKGSVAINGDIVSSPSAIWEADVL
jgi:prevent-host-death family protein